MSLGQTLQKARESRKLTASQVAAATHMKVQTVEAIEQEDFSRMPAAIYCKGFIKLYAEYLGLESEPLIREYVERFITPPAPPPEAQEDNTPVFAPMQSGTKEDLPPVAQETAEEDDAGLDLFTYGKKRKETPPENLFEHKQPELREEIEESSVADRISAVSSKLKNAVTLLADKISERSSVIKESILAGRPEAAKEEPEEQHAVDTSPITLPHRKILIISGAVAGVVLIIFLISAIARFSKDGQENPLPEDTTEQELILPAKLPPPYVD